MLNIRYFIAACMLMTSTLLSADSTQLAKAAVSTDQVTTDIEKLSMAFGNFIGKNLKGPGINFDLEALISGIRDGVAGKPSPMSEEEYEDALANMQEKAFNDISEQNLTQANTFLEKNSQEKNIVQLEPGKLQYEVIEQGKGSAVTEHSVPQLNYEGRFIDGTVFGSSNETGAIEIPLDQTIPGFSKGLVGMKEGEKRRLYIHPDLAYGTNGPLPPNSLLIFDIQIVNSDISNTVKDPEEAKDLTLGVAGKDLSEKENVKMGTTSIAIGTPVEKETALPNTAEKKTHTNVQETAKDNANLPS